MGPLRGVLVAISLQAGAVHAALVPIDSDYGPATVIRDTASGLDWLRLTVTSGLSYYDVVAGTTPGGRFDGFSIASRHQVQCQLLTPNLGLDAPCSGIGFRLPYEPSVQMRALFGARGGRYEPMPAEYEGGGWQSWVSSVYTYEGFGSIVPPHAEVDSQIVGLRPDVALTVDFSSPFYLVRSTSTSTGEGADPKQSPAAMLPEPASMALLVAGLLVLWARRSAARCQASH